MKRLSLVLLSVLFSATCMCQTIKGERIYFGNSSGWWQGSLKVKSNSCLITGIGGSLSGLWNSYVTDNIEEWDSFNWYGIKFIREYHAPYNMTNTDGTSLETGAPQWWKNWLWNWNYNFNIAPSYVITWEPILNMKRFVFSAGIGYEFKQVYFQDGILEGKHRTHAIVPSAAISYRLGSINESIEHLKYIELGVSYIYNLAYNNPMRYDVGAVNNGIRGRIGFVVFPLFRVSYEYDFFNYFNHNYSPDGGISHPLDGIKNNFGYISISFQNPHVGIGVF